jgi:hypothetical protein
VVGLTEGELLIDPIPGGSVSLTVDAALHELSAVSNRRRHSINRHDDHVGLNALHSAGANEA